MNIWKISKQCLHFRIYSIPPLHTMPVSPFFPSCFYNVLVYKLWGIKSSIYPFKLSWQMPSHFIVSKLLNFHISLWVHGWTNSRLEETLLQIITGSFPPMYWTGPSIHGDKFQSCFVSPCWDNSLCQSRTAVVWEVGLTDLCCYHCNVVPQQCFSVKEFRCKNGTISRINVEYSVHICVSIHRIPENAG